MNEPLAHQGNVASREGFAERSKNLPTAGVSFRLVASVGWPSLIVQPLSSRGSGGDVRGGDHWVAFAGLSPFLAQHAIDFGPGQRRGGA